MGMGSAWNPVVYRVTIPGQTVSNLQLGRIRDRLGLQMIQIDSMPDGSAFLRFYTSHGPAPEEETCYKDKLCRYVWADGKPVIDAETEENGDYTITKRPKGRYDEFMMNFKCPKASIQLKF
jgi:hypothetical protein